jgi:hypothetical protein
MCTEAVWWGKPSPALSVGKIEKELVGHCKWGSVID